MQELKQNVEQDVCPRGEAKWNIQIKTPQSATKRTDASRPPPLSRAPQVRDEGNRGRDAFFLHVGCTSENSTVTCVRGQG